MRPAVAGTKSPFLLLDTLGELLGEVVTGLEDYLSAFRERREQYKASAAAQSKAAAQSTRSGRSNLQNGDFGDNRYSDSDCGANNEPLPPDFASLTDFEKSYYLKRKNIRSAPPAPKRRRRSSGAAPQALNKSGKDSDGCPVQDLRPEELFCVDTCTLEFSGLALQWTDDDERKCSKEFLDAKLYQFHPLWPIGRGLCIVIGESSRFLVISFIADCTKSTRVGTSLPLPRIVSPEPVCNAHHNRGDRKGGPISQGY